MDSDGMDFNHRLGQKINAANPLGISGIEPASLETELDDPITPYARIMNDAALLSIEMEWSRQWR